MQYSTKLKKETVQVLKTERTENTTRNIGADDGEEEGGNDTGSGLVVKEKRTRNTSAHVTKEVVPDAAESGTSDKSPDDDHVNDDEQQEAAAADEQHSDYDPYKCDIDEDDDDDEEEDEDLDEDEENDETFTPPKQKQQQTAKRKRGRPPKVPSGGGAGTGGSHSNSARKSSRLKLVRKAIAKVKRDKNSNSNSKPFEKPKCTKCDYVAPSVDKLEQHVKRAHKDDTVYACGVCGYTCAWNREYYRHMKRHFRGPPYECDFEACDYLVDRIQPLLYHRMVSFLFMRITGLLHWFTLLMRCWKCKKYWVFASFYSLWGDPV